MELEDGLELAKTERVPTEAKERVLGWLAFYERDLLPTFWTLIEKERREEIIKRIRALRIMTETRASGEEMQSELSTLEELAFAGDAGLLLRAYRDAQLLGVPAGIRKQLTELCIAAARARLASQGERYQKLKADLKSKLEEAYETWRDWAQKGDVREGSPDLRVDVSGRRREK